MTNTLREKVALAIQAELERQWEAKEGRWLVAMPIADIVLELPEIAEALKIREAEWAKRGLSSNL